MAEAGPRARDRPAHQLIGEDAAALTQPGGGGDPERALASAEELVAAGRHVEAIGVLTRESAPSFGDLFADVLTEGPVRRYEGRPDRGADLHQAISISFEDAIRGGPWHVTVTRHGSDERQLTRLRRRVGAYPIDDVVQRDTPDLLDGARG